MKLPKDTDNWTLGHFEKAIGIARREFERYEKRINFDWPKDRQEDCYRPYASARDQAIEVARGLGIQYAIAEAEALP